MLKNRYFFNAMQKKCQEMADLPDNESNTPLHLAAEKGHVECVKQLIHKNINLEAENKDKQAPLHCAARRGHYS